MVLNIWHGSGVSHDKEVVLSMAGPYFQLWLGSGVNHGKADVLAMAGPCC